VRVVSHTPSRLVVTHRESRWILAWTVLCLATMTLLPQFVPVDMPGIEELPDGTLPHGARVVLAFTFLAVVGAAFLVGFYSETYTFDKARRTVTLRGAGPIGGKQRTLPIDLIRDVYQEHFSDGDTVTDHVIVVVGPDNEHLKLPMRIFSFSAEERTRFGETLSSFLGLRARLETR
jgi:hypothetical protein